MTQLKVPMLYLTHYHIKAPIFSCYINEAIERRRKLSRKASRLPISARHRLGYITAWDFTEYGLLGLIYIVIVSYMRLHSFARDIMHIEIASLHLLYLIPRLRAVQITAYFVLKPMLNWSRHITISFLLAATI